MEYVCNKCHEEFKCKQALEKHKNRKNKCDNITEYQCSKCKKYFSSKYYLKTHIDQCIENKIKDDTDELKKYIKSIVESDDSIEQQLLLLKIHSDNIDINKYKTILNSSIPKDQKIYGIYSLIKPNTEQSTIINSNNITNSNNTTNIQINQFGKEDVSYLDNDYFKKLLKHDRNLENSLITLTKDIHLRLDHPENRNIKVTNLNNKYATIYSNGKWRGITKESLKEELHKKNIKLIKIHYDQLKDVLNDKHKNNVKILLGRDLDEDPVLKEINDKIILLFYSKED